MHAIHKQIAAVIDRVFHFQQTVGRKDICNLSLLFSMLGLASCAENVILCLLLPCNLFIKIGQPAYPMKGEGCRTHALDRVKGSLCEIALAVIDQRHHGRVCDRYHIGSQSDEISMLSMQFDRSPVGLAF